MTTPIATVTDTVTYTAPGGPTNGQSPQTSVSANYDGMDVGTLEIPAATASGTVIPVPFGSIAVDARVIKVVNRATSASPGNTNSIGIRLNASSADIFDLAPGGEFTIANPIDPTTGLTSASIHTTALQGATPAYVDFYVFGT